MWGGAYSDRVCKKDDTDNMILKITKHLFQSHKCHMKSDFQFFEALLSMYSSVQV